MMVINEVILHFFNWEIAFSNSSPGAGVQPL